LFSIYWQCGEALKAIYLNIVGPAIDAPPQKQIIKVLGSDAGESLPGKGLGRIRRRRSYQQENRQFLSRHIVSINRLDMIAKNHIRGRSCAINSAVTRINK